jgi:antitoxin Phd
MRASLARNTKRLAASSHGISRMERWKLEDAKARFSEVVRLAGTAGPQLVTVRGREAAVILAPELYQLLLPKRKKELPLARFLKELGLAGVNVEREADRGREIDL